MTVHLLGLGGTISMTETAQGAVPAIGAAQLASAVGGFDSAQDVATVGGSEVDFPILERLVATLHRLSAEGADGVVVTTGTDSIEEVSAWLSYRERWGTRIVITGSMVTGARPDSDGPANLADARTVAAGPAQFDPAVVFAGRIFSGREVVKTSGLARDAFDAPGRGPLGIVGNGEVRWHRTPLRGDAYGPPGRPITPVPIVVAALGDDGTLLAEAGARHPAVVVAANGAGNLPPAQAAAASDLIDRGVLVVIATRAADALVAGRYGYPGGGATLLARGAVLAPGLTPHRARLLITLGLAQGRDLDGLRALVAAEAR